MHHFRNPWWPLITTTLPVAFLYYIFSEAVALVALQFSAAQTMSWRIVGVSCAILWVLHTGYALRYQFGGRKLDRRYGLTTLVTFTLFLLLCCCGSSGRIPEDVQGSVLGENRLLYAMACLSPTFIHGAIVLVLCPRQKRAVANHAKIAMSCGLFLILTTRILSPDLHTAALYIADALLVFTFVVLHYLAVRYTLRRLKKGPRWRTGMEYTFRLAGAIAYPLSGVLVNNDILFDIVFRTFAYPGFYLFSLINGVVICLPERGHRHWRMFLFAVRVVTFAFILVMQVLYLPLLPQSAMALAGFGLGYLMLAPILLTIIKTKMILTDLSFLKPHFSRKSVIIFSSCVAFTGLLAMVSLFQFEDEARALAAVVLDALAFRS